jgi:hypothetical protein
VKLLSIDPEQLRIFSSVSGELREKAGAFLSLMHSAEDERL